VPQVEIATDQGRRRLSWDAGRITVGRLARNDIVVPSNHVSRTHAELTYADGLVWITDLASGYGVWVGERRVTTCAMAVGQPVRIAPDVHLILIEGAPDLAAQPTTHLPALASQPLAEQPTQMRLPAASPSVESGPPARWLRASQPTVWAPRADPAPPAPASAQRRPTPDFASFEDEHDGDVFRRQATNPNADAPATSPRAGKATARLVACATCGERNPLGAVSCHGCGHSLALPCAACGLSLLAAQDRCPRCHTPNTGFAGRVF
jgi:ribosomal protein L40E